MYDRFTARSRKIINQLAKEEAQRFNHDYIGTEHILLGLIKEGSGVAANVLMNLGANLERVREEIENIIEKGPDKIDVPENLPFTPRAKKIIELAFEEAKRLKHNYIGTEHLLLGLIAEGRGVAAQALENIGITLDDVRNEVCSVLNIEMPLPGGSADEDLEELEELATSTLSEEDEALLSAVKSASELKELMMIIHKFNTEKQDAITKQNYEKAAELRDRTRALLDDIEKLRKKWSEFVE